LYIGYATTTEAVLAIRPGRPWPTLSRSWPTQTARVIPMIPTYTTSVGLPKICLAFDWPTQMKIPRTAPERRGLFCVGDRSQSGSLSARKHGGEQPDVLSTAVKSLSEVDRWLRSLQLHCYSTHFRRAGLSSFDAIRSVTSNDLVRIGVVSTEHQQILLNSIRHPAFYCRQQLNDSSGRWLTKWSVRYENDQKLWSQSIQLWKKPCTHKTEMTHAGAVFVTPDLWPFDPKINGFPRFIAGHFVSLVSSS